MAALQYDGFVQDAEGTPMGMITLKIAKAKAGATSAKGSCSLTLSDGKKQTLKGDVNLTTGAFSATAKDGRTLSLVLGVSSLSGAFGPYSVGGALNLFASKDAADKAAAAAVLTACGGVYTMALPSANGWAGLSVTVAAKGKAKVSGALADGTKVSITSQLIVGGDWCCVPMVYAKKGVSLAATLWIAKDGSSCKVTGVNGAQVGRLSALKDGLSFSVDAEELQRLCGSAVTVLAEPDYLPHGLAVSQNGAKWIVAEGAKAGKLVWDRAAGQIDLAKSKIVGFNVPGLKLTYTSKTGSFKGSFKVYTVVNGALKNATATVNGVVVDGIGYGSAAIKKLGSCNVGIKVVEKKAVLPDWAAGSFSGQGRNWASDPDPGDPTINNPVTGPMTITLAADGSYSFSLKLTDGTIGNGSGRVTIISRTDAQLVLTIRSYWPANKWWTTGTLTVSSNGTADFYDGDEENPEEDERWPLAATLMRE
ncbi:MAG: hypothetical protein MJ240_08915 [Kiritimatiellae bacterium]|nr:hypothetical protein [Kiritimatiellia bacterium]